MNDNLQFGSQLLGGRAVGLAVIMGVALIQCDQAVAQDGFWVNSHGGSWAAASSWDSANGIAGGTDSTAYFGFDREASISSVSTFTLDGNHTIGNLFFTSKAGAASWNFGVGSGGSLSLQNSFGTPQITVVSPGLQVAMNVPLIGTGGMEKNGAGTLVLNGANTYPGQTLVKGGAFDVNGSLAGGGIEVTNSVLAGDGVIAGPVVVDAGSTLLLGNGTAPMTISNTLVLRPGSTTVVAIGSTVPGRSWLKGLSHVTYGGTLVISNLAGGLALGQSFSIFGAVPADGNFSSIQPPPGPWLRWRFDPATGEISVVSSSSQPVFANANIAAGRLAMRLSGGPPGAPCYFLATTNLSLPRPAWTRIATNTFDVSGRAALDCAFGAGDQSQIYVTAYIIPAP